MHITSRRAVVDLETRSTVDLKKTNAYTYAQHPDTDVWMVCYAFSDLPDLVMTWWPGDPVPRDLQKHIAMGGTYSAHNAEFEFAIHTYILAPRYDWPPLRLDQLTDTAARAARCGLPRKLELAAPAAGVPLEKDMQGSRLMLRMAKPRRVEPDGTVVWWDVPDKKHRLAAYCETDVEVQMQLELLLPQLPETEWEIWQSTLRANYRGTCVDQTLVTRAQEILAWKLTQYDAELLSLSNGTCRGATDVNGLKTAVSKLAGTEVDSVAKDVVATLMQDPDLDPTARRMLTIRQEAGKSSVAKFPAMEAHSKPDGIARGQLVYYGAQATGRWAGAGIQLQNLPSRGDLKYYVAEELIQDICSGDDPIAAAEWAEDFYGGSIVEQLSMCLRGALTARPGHRIVCADFSNVEGRKTAWFGNEQWKLDAFRDYDRGEGPDLYKVTAGQILGLDPYEVNGTQRNVMGKVPELALGFGGGAMAFASMGRVYGVDMADYLDTVRENLDPMFWDKALDNWETFGSKSGMDRRAWVPSESIKLAWRARHPGLSDPQMGAWAQCETAAIGALKSPGQIAYACHGKLSFRAEPMFGGVTLKMKLPSGRCIYYAKASLRDQVTPWGAVKSQVWFDKVEKGRAIRSSTYGGDIFQSAVQGSARDIMALAQLRAEAAGYTPLFTVHDELASEVPEGPLADVKPYEQLLCDLPDWAAGLPLSAEGYLASRFRKD